MDLLAVFSLDQGGQGQGPSFRLCYCGLHPAPCPGAPQKLDSGSVVVVALEKLVGSGRPHLWWPPGVGTQG